MPVKWHLCLEKAPGIHQGHGGVCMQCHIISRCVCVRINLINPKHAGYDYLKAGDILQFCLLLVISQ